MGGGARWQPHGGLDGIYWWRTTFLVVNKCVSNRQGLPALSWPPHLVQQADDPALRQRQLRQLLLREGHGAQRLPLISRHLTVEGATTEARHSWVHRRKYAFFGVGKYVNKQRADMVRTGNQ